METLVSVIITTKNRIQFLKRAVDSVVAQTYKKIEIIVVDDGSNDETPQYLKSMSTLLSNFRFVANKHSLGGSGARNKGLEIARGQLVAFLDDDDEWLPEKIEVQERLLSGNSNLVGVSCSYEVYSEDKRISKIIKKDHKYGYKSMLEGDNVVGGCSFVLVQKIRGVNFDETLRACQDWDYWLQLSKVTNREFLVSSRILVKYNQHTLGNITNSFRFKIKGDVAFLRKYYKDISIIGFIRKQRMFRHWIKLFFANLTKI